MRRAGTAFNLGGHTEAHLSVPGAHYEGEASDDGIDEAHPSSHRKSEGETDDVLEQLSEELSR